MAKEPVLKTGARKGLRVRVPPPPPIYNFSVFESFLFSSRSWSAWSVRGSVQKKLEF